jgi:hypothetical protein
MRTLVLGAIIAIAALSGTARAEISEDLKFCAGRKASKERLACYDAAARLEQPRNVLEASKVVATPVVQQVTTTILRPSRFAGAYVGAFGGYDFSITSAYSGYGTVPRPDSVHGGFAGGVAGYNAVSGNILVGVEGRGQYNFGKAVSTADYPFNTPMLNLPLAFGGCRGCQPTDPFPGSNVTFQLVTDGKSTSSFYRPYSFDVSFRSGIVNDQWLLYGKAGAGIEKTIAKVVTDDSKSITCVNPNVEVRPVAGGADYYVTGCGIKRSGIIQTFVNTDGYAPVLNLGVGIERNFEAYFVRAEAELLGHFVPGGVNSFYYTPAVSIAAGYRF